jgi:hypothetical protein
MITINLAELDQSKAQHKKRRLNENKLHLEVCWQPCVKFWMNMKVYESEILG